MVTKKIIGLEKIFIKEKEKENKHRVTKRPTLHNFVFIIEKID